MLIEKNKPLVKTAYDILGESRVKALKYKVTDIRRELIKASTITETEKIIRMVKQQGHRHKEGTYKGLHHYGNREDNQNGQAGAAIQESDTEDGDNKGLAGDIQYSRHTQDSGSDRPDEMIRGQEAEHTHRGTADILHDDTLREESGLRGYTETVGTFHGGRLYIAH